MSRGVSSVVVVRVVVGRERLAVERALEVLERQRVVEDAEVAGHRLRLDAAGLDERESRQRRRDAELAGLLQRRAAREAAERGAAKLSKKVCHVSGGIGWRLGYDVGTLLAETVLKMNGSAAVSTALGRERLVERVVVDHAVAGDRVGLDEPADDRGVAGLHGDDLAGDRQVAVVLDVAAGAVVSAHAEVLERLRGREHVVAVAKVDGLEVGEQVRDRRAASRRDRGLEEVAVDGLVGGQVPEDGLLVLVEGAAEVRVADHGRVEGRFELLERVSVVQDAEVVREVERDDRQRAPEVEVLGEPRAPRDDVDRGRLGRVRPDGQRRALYRDGVLAGVEVADPVEPTGVGGGHLALSLERDHGPLDRVAVGVEDEALERPLRRQYLVFVVARRERERGRGDSEPGARAAQEVAPAGTARRLVRG